MERLSRAREEKLHAKEAVEGAHRSSSVRVTVPQEFSFSRFGPGDRSSIKSLQPPVRKRDVSAALSAVDDTNNVSDYAYVVQQPVSQFQNTAEPSPVDFVLNNHRKIMKTLAATGTTPGRRMQ